MLLAILMTFMIQPAWAGTGELHVYDQDSGALLARGRNALVIVRERGETDAEVMIESDSVACVIDRVGIEWAAGMKSYVNLSNWNASCRVSGATSDGIFHTQLWGISRPEDSY